MMWLFEGEFHVKANGYLTAFFAALVLIGGLIGYFVAHSNASLISSSISALFLFVASIALIRGQLWGLWLALAVCVMMGLFFTNRFFHVFTIVPLAMALLSFLLAGRLGWAWMKK
jgi:uncharacterized membrane protein (UPF0136 family)